MIEDFGDNELIKASLAGDTQAFSALIDRHSAHLERLLRVILNNRFELEDIWQETVLRAYLNLENLRDPLRFGAWLCSIGLNLARTQRSAQMPAVVPYDAVAHGETRLESSSSAPEKLYLRKEQAERVREAIADLPPSERNAIMLVYLGELSHKEAASQLGASLSAVKVRVHRGRKRLRSVLAGEFQTERIQELGRPAEASSREQIKEPLMIQVDIHDVQAEVKIGKEASHGSESESFDHAPFDLAQEPDPMIFVGNLLYSHRLVVLKERDGQRLLPIWIGPFEADSIILQLKEEKTNRPLTYDLTKALLDFSEIETERVIISHLHETIIYSNLLARIGDKVGEIDARPSDAINLAVRLGVPIFVSEELMEQAGELPSEVTPEEGFARVSLLDETVVQSVMERLESFKQEIGWKREVEPKKHEREDEKSQPESSQE